MRKAAGLILLLILSGAAPAEPVPAGLQPFLDRIEASITPVRAHRGETVVLRVHLGLKDRAHAYPTQDPNSELGQCAVPVRVKGPDSAVVVPVGTWKEPTYRTVEDSLLGNYRVVAGRAAWERRLVVSPKAKPGEHRIAVSVSGQIVNNQM